MERTFNLGIGMIAVVSPEDADRALALLTGRQVNAWAVGEIVEGNGQVRMVNSFTRG
jgi:phosphoribosylformylglycinamidine cyclo-ligase